MICSILSRSIPIIAQEIHEIAVVELEEAFEVIIRDDLAYVCDGFSGLRVINVSDPANPDPIGHWDSPGNNLGLNIENNLAFLADGPSGLHIVDIGEPGNIDSLGSIDTEAFARRVCVRDGHAYVVDYSGGLYIFDVSEPSNPFLVSQTPTGGDARDIQLRSSLAYISASAGGMRIFRIADPENPNEVGAVDTPGNSIGITLNQHYAYVADWNEGIRIIDIADFRNPIEVGFINTPNLTYDVVVQNNRLFTAEWEAGFRIFDLLDPENPELIGEFDTPGFTASITPDQTILYVCDYPGGLRIYDTSELFDPPEITLLHEELDLGVIHLGREVLTSMRITNTGDLPLEIHDVVSDNDAFIVEFQEGLTILPQEHGSYLINFEPLDTVLYEGTVTISSNDPENPEVNVSLTGSGRIQRIRDVAYLPLGMSVESKIVLLDEHVLLSKLNGFSVIDISDPFNPVEVDSFETEDYGNGIDVSGNLAISACADELYIFDVSNPEQIVQVGTFNPAGEIFSIALKDNFAYLSSGDENSTFQIINLSNPEDPTLVSEVDFEGRLNHLFIAEDFVWGSHSSIELVKINVNDPEFPEVAVKYPLDFPAHSIFVVDNVVYFTSGHTGVYALVIEDQNNLQIVNTPIPEWAWGITVQNDLMFVASTVEGMHILDISGNDHNMDSFLNSIAYINSGNLVDVVVRNGYAFAAGGLGLYIFDVSYHTGNVESLPGLPDSEIQDLFNLSPAFPNPFNSSTNLTYFLPRASEVSVDIYDIAGRHLVSLFDGFLNSGEHLVKWNSPNLAGGIYFVKLKAGEFSTIQKIVNLR